MDADTSRADRIPRPRIEVGWVLDPRLDRIDRDACEAALRELSARLSEELPQFDWRLPTVERDLVQAPVAEPVALLEAGRYDLAIHHWDFAVVVTASDLVSHYVPAAVAVPSRALNVAVISTFRIDPQVHRRSAGDDEREAALRRRLVRLGLRLVGWLAGLERSRGRDDVMASATELEDLDREASFDDRQRSALAAELERVADDRLEEEEGASGARAPSWGFRLRAAARNRREILTTLLRSRWWEFPFRMGRLTTTAVSALAILTFTAESWEVAVRLHPAVAGAFSLATVAATSGYVLRRQRLLELPGSSRATEQSVVASTSVACFALLGVAATYGVLLAISAALGALMVDGELAARWTGGDGRGLGAHALQAAFASGLSVLVGALGASFEGQSYAKHVAWVDEEL